MFKIWICLALYRNNEEDTALFVCRTLDNLWSSDLKTRFGCCCFVHFGGSSLDNSCLTVLSFEVPYSTCGVDICNFTTNNIYKRTKQLFRFLSICFLYSNVSYLSPTCAVVMRLYRFHINELIIVGTRCIFCSITSTKVITINFSIAHELICIKMHQIGAS